MSGQLKEKVKEMKVVENLKGAASALVSDVKDVAKDVRKAAVNTFDSALKNTKDVLHKVEKKLD